MKAAAPEAGPTPRQRLRLLRTAAFLSTFDRFSAAPMLVTIAAGLGVSLERAAAAASLYFLLYGLMQPVWGLLSDRLGRVRVMRIALIGALVPGLLSALAPNLLALVVGRALAGGSSPRSSRPPSSTSGIRFPWRSARGRSRTSSAPAP